MKHGAKGFILPIALALSALVAGTVIFCAALLRRSVVNAERNIFSAKAQALYGLDVALAQLQAVASADTTTTAPAKVTSAAKNSGWVGAYEQGGSAPIWLVSGKNSVPADVGGIPLAADITVPLVETSSGTYAYWIEDLSQKITIKEDRLASLGEAFVDVDGREATMGRLRQQTLFVPDATAVPLASTTRLSYGLLTNPISGGWKIDFDSQNSGDVLLGDVSRWRNIYNSDGSVNLNKLVLGRPLVWSKFALLMGVYKDAAGNPQLAAALWGNVWNPYPEKLPYTPEGQDDFRLRVQGPPLTIRFYNKGALVGWAFVNLSGVVMPVDIYGAMHAGEVRFITQYTLLPLDSNDPEATALADTISVVCPAGDYGFLTETFDNQLLQNFIPVHFDAATRNFGFNYKTLEEFRTNADANCQWIYEFQLNESSDFSNFFRTFDPRASAPYTTVSYTRAYGNDPLAARDGFTATSFVSSGIYRDTSLIPDSRFVAFDLPSGALTSVGSLYNKSFEGVPAYSLGSAAAGASNRVFDRYFFSTLPSVEAVWSPNVAASLPNANLRLLGTPSFAALRALPARYLLLQGAFNINTGSVEAWQALLPSQIYPFPFQPSDYATHKILQPVEASATERLGWAQGIVDRLVSRARPWRSLSEFAAEDILPPNVFCYISALLQPRGDTFCVHVRSSSQGATAALEALVQRLPTVDGNGRRFQVLEVKWMEVE